VSGVLYVRVDPFTSFNVGPPVKVPVFTGNAPRLGLSHTHTHKPQWLVRDVCRGARTAGELWRLPTLQARRVRPPGSTLGVGGPRPHLCRGAAMRLGLWVMRLGLYNACSLVQPGRVEHIAREVDADICAVVGTRIKAVDASHEFWSHSMGTCIQFGWAAAPFSNRAAGVAVLLSKKYQSAVSSKCIHLRSPCRGEVGLSDSK